MSLCPPVTNQSEQGKDPEKYKFSPYLAEVSWTFHGVTSLWAFMTMTEGVSVQLSQTIWPSLPSGNYSFDDSQWPFYWWGQWLLVLLYPLPYVALYWPLLSGNVPLLAFRILISCAFLPTSHSHILSILCWFLYPACTRTLICAVPHSLLFPHPLRNFETSTFLSLPNTCLNFMFSKSS